MFGYIRCPYCSGFMSEKIAHKVCPHCKSSLVDGSSNDDYTVFRSSNKNKDDDELPRFLRKRAVMVQDETFSSAGRNVYNQGYTQQSQSSDNSDNSKRVAGLFVGDSDDDEEFFSSKRARYSDLELEHRFSASELEKEYYTSKSNSPENDAQPEKNALPSDYSAAENPYEKSHANDAPVLTEKQLEDSTEYVANDIFEFTRHRFAKYTIDSLKWFFLGFVACDLFTFAVEVGFDIKRVTFVIVCVYTLLALVLLFIAEKRLSRKMCSALSFITLIFSAVMICFTNTLNIYMYPLEIAIFFLPILLQNVCCFFIMIKISSFHDKWDAYVNRDKLIVDVDFSTEDYQIYKSSKSDKK